MTHSQKETRAGMLAAVGGAWFGLWQGSYAAAGFMAITLFIVCGLVLAIHELSLGSLHSSDTEQ